MPRYLQRRPATRIDVICAVALSIGLFVLYQLNGDVLPGNDVTINVELPINILRRERLSFAPVDVPYMFVWAVGEGDNRTETAVWSWDDLGPGGKSWRELQRDGLLRWVRPRYYLAASTDTDRRGFVSTYGVGAGLVAWPVFAVRALLQEDFLLDRAATWYTGKLVASACVALSAACLFLAARSYASRWTAMWVVLAYGVGTSVWSMTSQALWQAGPTVLFLSVAIYCLLRVRRHVAWAACCGATTGCAFVCRESTIFFLLAVGLYLLWIAVAPTRSSRASRSPLCGAYPLMLFLLAGLPLALGLAWYNTYFLGSPLASAKVDAAAFFAKDKLGNADLWQTPFFTGFYGLLISPSRGILVYSPVVVFSLWGMVRVWTQRRFVDIRPLTFVVILLLLMYSKYFDWHSGWSFGSRYTIDMLPMLVVCGAAIAPCASRSRTLRALFLITLFWSTSVQLVGAFAYNVRGWNDREGYVLTNDSGQPVHIVLERKKAEIFAREAGLMVRQVRMNVDKKAFRRRLWSLHDNQLLYYATKFRQARHDKKRLIQQWLQPMTTRQP